jgi:hypothetical protein
MNVPRSSGVFRLPCPKARAVESQPLSFAGILDRATVLYARNFLPLVAMVVVTVLPVAIVQYVVLLRERSRIDATLDVLQHPEHLRTEHVPTLFDSPGTLAIGVAAVLFGYYMLAYAVAAVGAGVNRLYDGQPIDLRACYEAALQRWSSILAVVGIAVLGLIGAYAAAIFILAVPILATVAFAATWLPTVLPLAVTGVIAAIAFAFLVIAVTGSCAIYACVIEQRGAAASIRLTAARILNRNEFGRAIGCALVVSAIATIAFAFVDAVAVLGLSRWPGAYVTLDAVARSFVIPYLALVLAVYYFDVRMRHEGSDLASLAGDADEPEYAPTAYLSGEERALIKRFLERRDAILPEQRRQIAAKLAAPVRERVPEELQRLEDEPLLERL